LESNEKRAAAMAAFEGGYADLDALDATSYTDVDEFQGDVESILEAVASNLNEAAEMWRESASNIEDGFGHATSQSEEYEGYADEVESVACDVEALWNDIDSPAEDDVLVDWIVETIEALTSALGDAEGSLP